MVKIWGIPHNRRAKKFKGFVRIQAMKGGGYQAASWPRKGQYDKSPDGYERSRLFGLIQHWSTRPLWWEQLDALNLQVGTPYLARDILTKSAYGKLTVIKFKDGTTLYPEKIVTEEIQAGLDTISTTPGAMLVRTANEWVALEPGPNDTVLTAHGAGALPDWRAPTGGGGGSYWATPLRARQATSTANTAKGFQLRPFSTIAISGVAPWCTSAQPDAFLVTLAAYEDGEVTEVLHQATIANDSPSDSSIRPLLWGNPWRVEEGSTYVLLINAMNSGSTASWAVNDCQDDIPGVPVRPNQTLAYCTGQPQVGSRLTFVGQNPYWIASQWVTG